MTNTPSVSVAMATFNGARFVRRQLESIAGQSHRPAEIVVTDDCSTDDTVAIVRDFARSQQVGIQVFVNAGQLGYRANFMRAASLCTSELIAFCDQDDTWDKDKLQKCVEAFDTADVLLCYHNAVVVDEEGSLIGDLNDYGSAGDTFSVRRAQDFWFNAHGLAQVFRASLLRFSDLRPQSFDHRSEKAEPLAHDQWIFALAVALGSVRYLPDALVRYRQHNGNVVGFDGAAATWASFLTRASAMGADQYLRIARDARSRASIMSSVASRCEGIEMQRALASQKDYARLAALYQERAMVFGQSNIVSRGAALGRMLLRGGYWSASKVALGPTAFLKDCSYGLVLSSIRK